MKCPTVTPILRSHKTASVLILFTFLFGTASALGANTISIRGDNRISLPGLTVSSEPQQVYSGALFLTLANKNETNGWLLSGEVADGSLVGSSSGERIPATLSFTSITWVKGGNGSAAGITVRPDGKSIEADPGFGLGNYKIQFEIRYDAPAFPTADQYYGVSTFTVQ